MGPTVVHSWGLVVALAPFEATDAKDWFGLLVVAESELEAEVEAGVVVVEGCGLVRALALDSIWWVAVSMWATWEAMIVEADCSLPFSVYSRKISRRSRSFDCSSCDFVRVQACTSRSLASRIFVLVEEVVKS